MQRRKSNGPRTEPCSTPDVNWCPDNIASLVTALDFLSCLYPFNDIHIKKKDF